MSSSRIRTVGVVELGAMGRPIAEFIARAGFEVLAHDLAPDATAGGVVLVDSLAQVAAADVVMVIVPTDDDVRGVVTGLIASGHEDLIIALSSSIRPDTCRQLASDAARVGVHVIDAALTGGVRGAESGQIKLLVGGDTAVVERLRSVFLSFATSYHLLGGVGAGQVGKSAGNLIHWAQIVAIDEALRMSRSLGVQPSALRQALANGVADSRALHEIELMRFTWYKKDIAIAQEMAAGVGKTLPVAELSRRLMDDVTVATVRELFASNP